MVIKNLFRLSQIKCTNKTGTNIEVRLSSNSIAKITCKLNGINITNIQRKKIKFEFFL